jgi:hypothetical protein
MHYRWKAKTGIPLQIKLRSRAAQKLTDVVAHLSGEFDLEVSSIWKSPQPRGKIIRAKLPHERLAWQPKMII